VQHVEDAHAHGLGQRSRDPRDARSSLAPDAFQELT
jgi:hypothetical protein